MSEFVPIEIAKRLKEKGFPQGNKYDITEKYYTISNIFSAAIMAIKGKETKWYCPTIAQVLKWLREQKKLNVEIFLYNRTYSYCVKSVTKICEDCHHQCLNDDTTEEEYDSYEEAALAGIDYVLNNLI